MIFLRQFGELRGTDPSLMFRYGLLHSGYRPKKFWWELVVNLRKGTLIVLTVISRSDSFQLQFGVAVMIIALHLNNSQRPFGESVDLSVACQRLDARERQELERRTAASHMLHKFENASLLNLVFLLWSGQ